MDSTDCMCGPHDAVCRCAEVAELRAELDSLTRARVEARAGGAPQAAIDAACSLWPAMVGGHFPAVVAAFAAYGERCAKALQRRAKESEDAGALARQAIDDPASLLAP